jgi:N-acetylglucosamine-6-phosphate deacetylase
MLVLTGADLVVGDRLVRSGTLTVRDGRIVSHVETRSVDPTAVALDGCTILPGFIDVHVHGADGIDTLDDGEPVARLAAQLPRYGVTSFCPTTIACSPGALTRVLDQIQRARTSPDPSSARVLPAHVESSFISPAYAGAQPESWVCTPVDEAASAVLGVLDRHRQQIAIVTIAPEVPGGLQLIAWLCARQLRVSLGHSGATYDEALAAIEAGARHATHLFNRMPPFHHRNPGLVGAVLDRDEVTAEVICDGAHVHPSLVRMAVALKGTARVVAITDGTSVAGCPVGVGGLLGGLPITAGNRTALLPDGTIAGSVITMDAAFRWLTGALGLSMVDAAAMCATTPARALGLSDVGSLDVGAAADLVVLDQHRRVVRTYVAGQLVYDSPAGAQ